MRARFGLLSFFLPWIFSCSDSEYAAARKNTKSLVTHKDPESPEEVELHIPDVPGTDIESPPIRFEFNLNAPESHNEGFGSIVTNFNLQQPVPQLIERTIPPASGNIDAFYSPSASRKLDILIVLDTSKSMADYIVGVANSLARLTDNLDPSINWQIKIAPSNRIGWKVGQTIVTYKFLNCPSSFTKGADSEVNTVFTTSQAFKSALVEVAAAVRKSTLTTIEALVYQAGLGVTCDYMQKTPVPPSFVRPGSTLAIIFVSNSNNCSRSGGCNDASAREPIGLTPQQLNGNDPYYAAGLLNILTMPLPKEGGTRRQLGKSARIYGLITSYGAPFNVCGEYSGAKPDDNSRLSVGAEYYNIIADMFSGQSQFGNLPRTTLQRPKREVFDKNLAGSICPIGGRSPDYTAFFSKIGEDINNTYSGIIFLRNLSASSGQSAPAPISETVSWKQGSNSGTARYDFVRQTFTLLTGQFTSDAQVTFSYPTEGPSKVIPLGNLLEPKSEPGVKWLAPTGINPDSYRLTYKGQEKTLRTDFHVVSEDGNFVLYLDTINPQPGDRWSLTYAYAGSNPYRDCPSATNRVKDLKIGTTDLVQDTDYSFLEGILTFTSARTKPSGTVISGSCVFDQMPQNSEGKYVLDVKNAEGAIVFPSDAIKLSSANAQCNSPAYIYDADDKNILIDCPSLLGSLTYYTVTDEKMNLSAPLNSYQVEKIKANMNKLECTTDERQKFSGQDAMIEGNTLTVKADLIQTLGLKAHAGQCVLDL